MEKRVAFIVGGLSFGDEGKGTTVDYLVNTYGAHTVIRYNGGSQAAHNVVTPSGLHHCFAQFGSGTLVPDTATYLSKYMFVDPLRLVSEWEVLAEKGVRDALLQLTISTECPIITPFHKFTGQIRELARGTHRLGSCGMGVGEAMNDFLKTPDYSLLTGDLQNADIVYKKLQNLQKDKYAVAKTLARTAHGQEIEGCLNEMRSKDLLERCCESYKVFSRLPITFDNGSLLKEILGRPGVVVFEGAQGALLDRNFGFKPFVTKSDCTFANAQELLTNFSGKIVTLGVVRAYATRHGNGPFVTEDAELTKQLPDMHNTKNCWQGKFRIGWFDMVALRYALQCVGKVDGLVVTNLDKIKNFSRLKICVAYDVNKVYAIPKIRSGEEIFACHPVYEVLTGKNMHDQFLKHIRDHIPVPIAFTSYGTTSIHKLKEKTFNVC